MINHIEAIKHATQYLTDAIKDVKNIIVEEVAKTSDDKFWDVTLSFTPTSTEDSIPMLFSKKYKKIRLNSSDGGFVALESRIST